MPGRRTTRAASPGSARVLRNKKVLKDPPVILTQCKIQKRKPVISADLNKTTELSQVQREKVNPVSVQKRPYGTKKVKPPSLVGCVCCGKSARARTHSVDSVRGEMMNLRELIKRFGGKEVSAGNVCGDCVLRLQSLEAQCGNFFKLCQEKTPLLGTTDSLLTEKTSASDMLCSNPVEVDNEDLPSVSGMIPSRETSSNEGSYQDLPVVTDLIPNKEANRNTVSVSNEDLPCVPDQLRSKETNSSAGSDSKQDLSGVSNLLPMQETNSKTVLASDLPGVPDLLSSKEINSSTVVYSNQDLSAVPNLIPMQKNNSNVVLDTNQDLQGVTDLFQGTFTNNNRVSVSNQETIGKTSLANINDVFSKKGIPVTIDTTGTIRVNNIVGEQMSADVCGKRILIISRKPGDSTEETISSTDLTGKSPNKGTKCLIEPAHTAATSVETQCDFADSGSDISDSGTLVQDNDDPSPEKSTLSPSKGYTSEPLQKHSPKKGTISPTLQNECSPALSTGQSSAPQMEPIPAHPNNNSPFLPVNNSPVLSMSSPGLQSLQTGTKTYQISLLKPPTSRKTNPVTKAPVLTCFNIDANGSILPYGATKTGQILLKCTNCSKAFFSEDLLQTHIRQAHPTQEKVPVVPSSTSSPSKCATLISLLNRKPVPSHRYSTRFAVDSKISAVEQAMGVAPSNVTSSAFSSGSPNVVFVKLFQKGQNRNGSALQESAFTGMKKVQTVLATSSKFNDHTYITDQGNAMFTTGNSNQAATTVQDNQINGPSSGRNSRFFLCHLCNISHFSNPELVAHWESKHDHLYIDRFAEYIEILKGPKRFKCNICGFEHKMERPLRDHIMQEHNMIKPFKCTLCDRCFLPKRKMKKHLREHIKPSGPLRCSRCDKTFSNFREIDQHFCRLVRTASKTDGAMEADEAVESDESDEAEEHEASSESNSEPKSETKREMVSKAKSKKAAKVNLPRPRKTGLECDKEGDISFPCPLCKLKFRTKRQVLDHWRDDHNSVQNNGDKAEECPSSCELESNESVAESSGSGSDRNMRMFLCCLCQTAFISTLDLREHWREFHECLYTNEAADYMEVQSGLEKLKCKLCSSAYRTESAMMLHLSGKHGIKACYKCIFCPRTCKTQKKIRVHLRYHFPTSIYRCSHCSQTFKSQEDLFPHSCWKKLIRKRMEEPFRRKYKPRRKPNPERKNTRSYECCLCRQDLGSTHNLSKHWQETHDHFVEELPQQLPASAAEFPKPKLTYQCEHCGEEFNLKRVYLKHLSKHELAKIFKCSVCHMTFPTRHKTRLHLRVHLAERPHVCTLCGKKFFEKKHFKRHMLTIHGPPEDRHKFVCEVCGKGFRTIDLMKQHKMAMHDDGSAKKYECDICGKTFHLKSKLLYHRPNHFDSAPHLCSICGKSFKNKMNLRAHQRCHDNKSRHSCSKCNRTFSHRLVRTAHRMVEHDRVCVSCGLDLYTLKDALMHRHVCDGFEKTAAVEDRASSLNSTVNLQATILQ